jgi:hypothetical protein
LFRPESNRLNYDLPVDGDGHVGDFAIRADSSLENDGSVALEVISAPAPEAALAVRVPGWSNGVAIESGDLKLESELRDGYRVVRRIWTAGEQLTLRYEPKTRLERNPAHSKQVAVFNGPWLLAVSETNSPYFFDEPYEHNRVNAAALLQPNATAIEEAHTDVPGGKFHAPFAYREIEWTPAGYRDQPLKTQLRPISERTSEAALARWDFWFREGEAPGSTGPRSDHSRRTPWFLGGGSAIVIILLAAAWARRRRRLRQT